MLPCTLSSNEKSYSYCGLEIQRVAWEVILKGWNESGCWNIIINILKEKAQPQGDDDGEEP